MFGRAVQRQNSVPSPGIPVKLMAPPESTNSRRMSHDVGSVKITRPKSQHRMSQPAVRLQSISGQSPVMTISFGYASSVNQYEQQHRPVIRSNSSHSDTTYADEEQPSTSSFNSPLPHHPNQLEEGDDRMVEFYIRLADRQVVPLYCECPSGSEADLFLQSLPDKQKERLRKFIETEAPDCGEWHVWVKDDFTNQITVISLKTLENHLRNQNNRRVKWRHVSLDKISVYRYSVPVITTKFRLRLVHFLSRNYRCLLLCVWCGVIFFISIGIVLTVVFGSNSPGNNRLSNGTTTPRAGQPFTGDTNRNLSSTFLTYVTNGGGMG